MANEVITSERAIFLSAGIPDEKLERWRPDVLAIREAVLALVSVVVPKSTLVFGGHPAISPLVEHAARSLGAADNVFIYQSRWFEDKLPPEARAFKNLVLTDRAFPLDESLRVMRTEMLGSKHFIAGVFIGGMQGILDEFEMFRSKWPNAPALPVASTGGAARELFSRHEGPTDALTRDRLAASKRYRELFRTLLGEHEGIRW